MRLIGPNLGLIGPILGTIMIVMKDIKHNLADALFPKVRQQVLGILYSQPDRRFYSNEIIRITGSGRGAVQRELERLTAVGLTVVEEVGRQKMFKANSDSPLFSELRSIILKTSGMADVIKQALIPVIDDIQIAFIYGSVAKQEDTATSDIDLMLISDGLSYAEIFPLLEPCQSQLGRKINPTFYFAKEWSQKRDKQNNFVKKVLDQPKIFLIGTEDELKQLR